MGQTKHKVDKESLLVSTKGKKNLVRAAQRTEIEIAKRGYKRKYIVSSVVEGSAISWDFIQAMELYAKKNNAELVLLWMRGVYKQDHFDVEDLSKLRPYLASEFRFNSKLFAKSFLIHPSQKYPITGLQEYAQSNDSLICASTKQCLEVVPRPKGKVPHTIHTTGTVSIPNYSKTRTGCIAQQDNKLGALVIEIVDNSNFFIRQVQWIDHGFVDLGIKYTKSDATAVSCEAMVLGDLHLTEEDPKAIRATYAQFKHFKPKNIFLHDILSNNSINHHDTDKCVTKVKRVKSPYATLEKELDYGKRKLKEIKDNLPKDSHIYVVPSNHDDFIKTFCEDGHFVKDPLNAVMGAKCFICLVDNKNPLEVYLGMEGVTFLKKDSSLQIEGWECAEHGNLGSNGAKGSARSYMKSHGKAFIGHSHTPKIIGNIWQVGTLSKLSLPYTKGASSWMHANGVIYEGGYTQMIVFIGEKWNGNR